MSQRASIRLLLLLVILVAGGLYLLGNERVALWDRDEPRYAQTSRQMLQSGDWIVPRLLDKPRTIKPIFIYWCQASAMRLFGDNASSARLPSVIAMILTLVLLGGVLYRFIGPSRALWTVFIFATSALTIMAAKMCITDSVLLLWITIAQMGLYAIWRGRATWPAVIVTALAVGMAGLTKGPVVLGVMGMTLAALWVIAWIDRRKHIPVEGPIAGPQHVPLNALKIIVGIALVAAVLAPWLVPMELRDPGYTLRTIWTEVLTRSTNVQEGHKGPPGYYALTIWGTYFPWSVLLPATLVIGWKHRAVAPMRFALAAVIGPWLMFEIVRTKLPHYFLPCYPPLAFLTGDLIVRCIRRQHEDLNNRGATTVMGIWAIIVVLLGLAPWLAVGRFDNLPYEAMTAFSVIAIVYASAVFLRFREYQVAQGAGAMGLGMIAVMVVLFGFFLPRADFLRLSPRVADVLISHGATRPNDVIMIDYKEPSLAFYQGGTIRERDDGFLSSIPKSDWPTWIVLTSDVWRTMPQNVKQQLEIVDRVDGLAYADSGRTVQVMIVRKTPQ